MPGNASNDDFLLGYGVRAKRGEGICGGEEEGITIRDFGFMEGGIREANDSKHHLTANPHF